MCLSIFLAGGEKLAQNAEMQAAVIATNILRSHELGYPGSNPDRAPSNLVPFILIERIVVVSLGKYDGLICFGPWYVHVCWVAVNHETRLGTFLELLPLF